MDNEVLDYLNKKHMTYTLADGANGKEAIVTICPYCKAKSHFYFNLTNKVFYCHKCLVSGGLFSLKAELGDVASVAPIAKPDESELLSIEDKKRIDEAHNNLHKDRETLAYLSNRGFTAEAINHFKLGVADEMDGKKWLWIPYFDATGNVCNVKKRSLPPAEKAFKRWIGRESTLFNEVALQIPSDHIILCEGETDTIALWSIGITNVIGVPTGAKGFNSKWTQQLDKYHRIYIVYDQDTTGYEGTYGVAARLGYERCYTIKLPPDVNDINDYTRQGHTAFDFKKLLNEAKLLDVQYVNSISGELEKYMNATWVHKTNEDSILEIPWGKLQAITNGFVPGDLIVLASRPGMGKTEMALNFLYKYASIGIPSLLFSLEMRLERLLPRLVGLHLQKDSKLVNTFDCMKEAHQKLKHMPLYMAYVYKKPNFDFVADTIRMCVRRYGVKFVVFDNLHFLVRSLNDQTREVSVIVQGFKLLAEEVGIPILLIARPRKSQTRIMTNMDLKDSADIEGDADMVIILHREYKNKEDKDDVNTKEGIFEPKTLVRVSKCRYACGGDLYLTFNDATCTIKEE